MIRLMRSSFALFILFTLTSGYRTTIYAQGSTKINLDKIYRLGLFDQETLEGLNSMNDGVHYTVQSFNRIDKYSYKTGEWVETLFDATTIEEFNVFDSYQFCHAEMKILIETGHEKIYRHSSRAEYFVYDIPTGKIEPVSSGGKQQLCTLSPSGSHLAFVRDNNIYLKDIESGKEIQITSDGIRNEVINGAPDWVYEEEFAFSQGFYWSPDGKKIAFYRFDEKRVKQFHMTMFGPLYPHQYEFKYPKAGEENSIVSIHVYDLELGKISNMDIGQETNLYIPRIKWTSNPEVLSIMRLNRLQNQLEILHADAGSGKSKVVYLEQNLKYISEASDNTVIYLEDGEQFILNSERDGYFHFYLYNFRTGIISPITAGEFDIHSFLGYDPANKLLYYTSYEESSTERHVYSIRLDGSNKKKLSTRPGTNTATFSTTFKYFILNHSSSNNPEYITLNNKKGKEVRVLVDNVLMREAMSNHGFSNTEFLTVPTASGQNLNAWMIKPDGFDPKREYPLFVYVYGGPESQKVINEWGSRTAWFQMLTQMGYIVACVDNRGTNGRGESFRKATYMTLGHLETIDQLESARWFGSQDYIDSDRMGIFGWSYGGFMTSLCMTKGKGTFSMGIAVAPVTNWRYYNTIYTERFMRTPRENPEGYDGNSPIYFAGGLEGKFLLVHGSGDDNVHYQNSMDFVEALVQSDKQFEMQFYPNKDHFIEGGNTSFHLYSRMTDFILENL